MKLIQWSVEHIAVGEHDIVVSYNEHGCSTFYHASKAALLRAVMSYSQTGDAAGNLSDGDTGSANEQLRPSSPSAKRNLSIGLKKLNWDIRIGRGVLRGDA